MQDHIKNPIPMEPRQKGQNSTSTMDSDESEESDAEEMDAQTCQWKDCHMRLKRGNVSKKVGMKFHLICTEDTSDVLVGRAFSNSSCIRSSPIPLSAHKLHSSLCHEQTTRRAREERSFRVCSQVWSQFNCCSQWQGRGGAWTQMGA